MKKYELTDEIMAYNAHVLHRIKALHDFGDVKEGDLGGWIESEENLSQEGSCWANNKAKIYGSAQVSGDAKIFDRARVLGDARVFGSARVFGDAEVCGSARVFGVAMVFESARVFGNAIVFGSARVSGDAKIGGSACVFGSANIKSNALIKSTSDYLTIGPIGSRDDITTFYRDTANNILVTCGCFNGSIGEFEKAVECRHASYMAAIQFVHIHFNEENITKAREYFDTQGGET